MHTLPQPPSDIETIKSWAIFLAGIAWVVYQTWQSKVAAQVATRAAQVADTNTERLNGHAKIIQGVKDALSETRAGITPAPVVAAAITAMSNPPAPPPAAEPPGLTGAGVPADVSPG